VVAPVPRQQNGPPRIKNPDYLAFLGWLSSGFFQQITLTVV